MHLELKRHNSNWTAVCPKKRRFLPPWYTQQQENWLLDSFVWGSESLSFRNHVTYLDFLVQVLECNLPPSLFRTNRSGHMWISAWCWLEEAAGDGWSSPDAGLTSALNPAALAIHMSFISLVIPQPLWATCFQCFATFVASFLSNIWLEFPLTQFAISTAPLDKSKNLDS